MDAIVLGVDGLLRPTAPAGVGPTDTTSRLLRSALRRLQDTAPVVLLERGPFDPLENWARESGLAPLTTFRLWTARLGDQARPPSRLPFRFLQRRLDLRPSEGLYVGCDPATLAAARRAGWETWDVREEAGPVVPAEIIDLVRSLWDAVRRRPDAPLRLQPD